MDDPDILHILIENTEEIRGGVGRMDDEHGVLVIIFRLILNAFLLAESEKAGICKGG